ncbi:hypothetical protein SprV_0100193200 [Sparganum proliferum]
MVSRQRQQSGLQLTCGSLTLWPPPGLQTEPHLEDDEAVVRPATGVADRLGHHHVQPILPPVLRPRMHPGDLLPQPQAEECVSQQEAVFSTGSREEEAGHCWGVGANDGGEVGSPKRQAQARQPVVYALRQRAQSSSEVALDGKGDACVSSLCPGTAAPEEDVADTHLLQLTLLEETGLAECSDVHFVARQFPSD